MKQEYTFDAISFDQEFQLPVNVGTEFETINFFAASSTRMIPRQVYDFIRRTTVGSPPEEVAIEIWYRETSNGEKYRVFAVPILHSDQVFVLHPQSRYSEKQYLSLVSKGEEEEMEWKRAALEMQGYSPSQIEKQLGKD